MRGPSCRCGASWTGLRIEHCPGCHETFTGTTAGDRHRVGEHAVSTGPTRRRCLTADEMRERGMVQNAKGHWTNGGTSPWAKVAEPEPCEHDSLGCRDRMPHDEHTKLGDGRPCCGWPPRCASDPVSRAQAIEAAEDRAEQVAFDAWREREL